MSQQAYNGYAPGPDGRPIRVAAYFKKHSWKVSADDEPLATKSGDFILKYHADGIDTTFRPATEQDKKEYPNEWAAYQRGDAQDELGWSIDKVPFLNDAQSRGYRDIGIKTLEALAGALDSTVAKVMGGREHREQARALLKETIDKKPLMDALSKVEAQGKELAEMKAKLDALTQAAEQSAPVVQQSAPAVAIKPGRKKAAELSGLAPAVLAESDD